MNYARFMNRSPKAMSPAIRKFHRWFAVAFLLFVVFTTVAMAQPEPMAWAAYVPLAPLGLLSLSGIFLLVRPLMEKRSKQNAPIRT
ncbi:MAG: hypothetical protein R3C60_05060 [Parvularculaceae bacterium]